MSQRSNLSGQNLFLYNTRPISLPSDSQNSEFNKLKQRALDVLAKYQEDAEINKAPQEQRNNLKEYNYKILKLKLIRIPDENNQQQNYCELAESAGGVTEKIALVSLSQVEEKLNSLIQDAGKVAYSDSPEKYAFKMEGIIKLPKHGKITEVQREAVALTISQMLGFDTTRALLVSYGGQPGLFVPFEDIRLLQEFAEGKIHYTATRKQYLHYSTIQSLGEKLESDQSIEDFGKFLAYFYLCNDPDAIGGYNQNKALRDSKSLYIFDQVFMNDKNFVLDSNLSLYSSGVKKYSRHFEGRNKTLIEDSSFDEKFAGIIRLLQHQEILLNLMDYIIETYQEQINHLIKTKSPSPQNKLATDNLTVLLIDAAELKETLKKRIEAISKIMVVPLKSSGDVKSANLSKQCLLLEKLANRPRLFTVEGRPYRHPWTESHRNKISYVVAEENSLKIVFDSGIDSELINILNRNGSINIQMSKDNKTLLISSADLNKLHETSLFPEYQSSLQPKKEYLNFYELKYISNFYGVGHRTRTFRDIEIYQKVMADDTKTPMQKIQQMEATLARINAYVFDAQDRGFLKHVLKKLHRDIQQNLQTLTYDPALNIVLTHSFEAAITLDRVAAFNKTVMTAIKVGNLHNKQFSQYLTTLLHGAAEAVNYTTAKACSQKFLVASKAITQAMTTPGQAVNMVNQVSANEGYYQSSLPTSASVSAAVNDAKFPPLPSVQMEMPFVISDTVVEPEKRQDIAPTFSTVLKGK
jgi:hypothetical protein